MFQIKILKVLPVVLMSYSLLVTISYAETTYKVKPTDSLSHIVDKFYKDSKLSRYQIYIGVLAENPKAFRLGNIHYLKRGQLLNLPDSNSLLAMEQVDAKNLVAEHNANVNLGKRAKINPPFEDYSPKNSSLKNKPQNSTVVNTIAEKQQATNQQLEKLNIETEALRLRLKQLAADKEAMDAELLQLNSLIKQ